MKLDTNTIFSHSFSLTDVCPAVEVLPRLWGATEMFFWFSSHPSWDSWHTEEYPKGIPEV